MLTIMMQTMWESLHRRVALAMLVVALIAAGTEFSVRFHGETGKLLVKSGPAMIPAQSWVSMFQASMLSVLSGPWMLLAIFAVAPLLGSHLERGWADLLWSKGVARWQVVTARLAGCMAVYVALLMIMAGIPCSYLAWRAGTPIKPLMIALLLITFSYLAYVAIMLLISTSQANPAAMIGVAFVQLILTAVLFHRKDLYKVITWTWVQWLMDWAYRLLPKNNELQDQAAAYLTAQLWKGWWPVWTTAVFIAVATGWSYWRFEKKAL